MQPLSFSPFPELTTARLLLRRAQLTDAPALFAMRANPELMRFVPRPVARTIDDVVALIQRFDEAIASAEGLSWAITPAADPSLMIGFIGFVHFTPESHRAEIGYMLAPDYHGQGLVSEALQAVVAYGFQTLQLHSVEAVINPDNTASRRTVERNGFVLEAHFRDYQFFNGQYLDSLVYSRLTDQ